MKPNQLKAPAAAQRGRGFLWLLLTLLFVVGLLFSKAFLADYVVFSNDGPLGAQAAAAGSVPEAFRGWWVDLNWIGFENPAAPLSLTYLLKIPLGPLAFAKFNTQLSILLAGLAAWMFFVRSGFKPLAAVLGGLAVALNSTFFSAACWGLGVHTVTVGWAFAALAALTGEDPRGQWLRTLLGGACVGAAIQEGFDIGAILSLLVAAFVVFQAFHREGAVAARAGQGIGRLVLVALMAALVAAQAMISLVGTQIQGVAGTGQEDRTKQERWEWATQWSLPKREALSLFIPGLFGYRLDTPQSLSPSLQEAYEGGNYWGAMGRDAAWDRYFAGGAQGEPPPGFIRHTGGGMYAGVLVGLVAFWALLQSLRQGDSPYSPSQRRWIWFWGGTALVALLLTFGRYAPFYQFLYQLPYFSTIRNPLKFNQILSIAWTTLFAFGVQGLSIRYLGASVFGGSTAGGGRKGWWNKAAPFERLWTYGCAVALGLSLVGWGIYASYRPALEQYLQRVQFDPALAKAIAGFSLQQVGVFVALLAISAGVVILVMSGQFAGRRAMWGGLLLGVVLVGDLGLANRPWISFWNYKEKYATNPILDRLREQAHEHRVAGVPFQAPPQLALFDQLYRIEWVQHHFQYYNIQSLDLIQMSRQPEDFVAFESAMAFRNTPETLPRITRRWELTNTRYLLGPAGFLELLNTQVDADKKRFRIAALFDVRPKSGVSRVTRLDQLTAVPSPEGPYALFEFSGALPRASLHSDWVVMPEDQATLARLTDANFDPHTQVLVSNQIPPPAAPGQSTNAPGTVSYVSYQPKHVVLQATTPQSAVLLLNDRYDSDWQALVDGRPVEVLRCNYLMRGVQLEPGQHTVEFIFRPPALGLYITAAAWGVSLVLLGLFLVSDARRWPIANSQ